MKKNIFLLSVALFTLFISACGTADEDGIFAGSACTFEGSETCSDDGVDILVCQSSTWTSKKQCNISIGKRCKLGVDGNLGCFGDGETQQPVTNDDTDNTNSSNNDADTVSDVEVTDSDNQEETDKDTVTEEHNEADSGENDSDNNIVNDSDNNSSDSNDQDITTPADEDTDVNDEEIAPDDDEDSGIEISDYDADTESSSTGECSSNDNCSGATPYCSLSTSECIANAVFITEYVKGSTHNKAIEIYNGSKSSVNLSNFTIQQANNGKSFGSDANYIYNFPASSQLAPGATYVVCNNLAEDSLLSHCDDKPSTGSTLNFNGDDGMALFEGSSIVDQIGNTDFEYWDVAGVSNATNDHTLRRKTSVIQGTTDWETSFGTTTENSEWIVLDKDTFDGLGTR